jgi:pimeloyl-ACP methyl ester carboxylesterase
MLLQRALFTTALTCTSRAVQLRDRMLGRVPESRPACGTVCATDLRIRSGKNLLDAVYVKPASGQARTAVLICHGIGEVVGQWFPIQRMLAENGIASLVFDYSGYGRSSGFVDWSQCEDDAVVAFQAMQEQAPGVPVSLLGFSLGTGIAPAVLHRIRPDRLVLCAGYSSFRKAARAAWIPGFLSFLVPAIWSAEEALRNCSIPILIVQGEHDGLFNMRMAQELVACSREQGELLVLPARSHNAPFYFPTTGYWGPIMNWLLEQQPRANAPVLGGGSQSD